MNGIPVATCEIKTDYIQAVEDAVLQYRKDRPPRVAGSNAVEPLLAFPQGALVHFALSSCRKPSWASSAPRAWSRW